MPRLGPRVRSVWRVLSRSHQLETEIMVVVGLVAALGPARWSLRIHPVDALRAEG